MARQSRARVGRPRKNDERQSRERILRASEYLFAERGLHRVSIRDITEKAGVSLSLIKYYFESRQGLIEEVIRRSTAPTIKERHIRLDECVAQFDAGKEPGVEAIIDAYIGPALTTIADGSSDNDAARRIVGYAWIDPDPGIRKLMNDIYRAPAERFMKLLRSACPHLSEDEFGWRVACIFGVTYTMVTDPARVKNMVGAIDFGDTNSLRKYVISFLAAGIKSSPTRDGQ